jgi:anti-sigma-K factor RskA
MTDSRHAELTDLAGLYLVGALTPGERQEFEAHLETCAVCQGEIGSMRPAVDALLLAVPSRVPPIDLRRRVLRDVADLPSAADSEPQKPRPTGLAWIPLAASLLAALALGLYAWQLRSRVQNLETRLALAMEQAASAQREILGLRQAALEARSTLAVLAAPDLARIELAGQPAAPQARARAFWSRSRGLVLTASNLPPPPPGRVYQLWVVTADRPISAGLLEPNASGDVTATIQTPADLPTPVAMAVTLEPAGGVPLPTGERYLLGTPATNL